MQRKIRPEDGRKILEFLSGEYVVELCDGHATLYCTCLPGDTVSAAMQDADGHIHLFVDLNKPQANRHAREMVRQWLGATIEGSRHPLIELLVAT